MGPTFLQIVILGLIQGAAELLPVSSSAHVIAAEKLMRLDPSSPEMTFMLVMLHTGTMGAVILYFWRAWKKSFFSDSVSFKAVVTRVAVATAASAVVYEGLVKFAEKFILHGGHHAEVEQLFSKLPLIALSLAGAGLIILVAGLRSRSGGNAGGPERVESTGTSFWIGVVQGVSIPFRGFSRSGVTISTAMLLGIGKRRAEEFSFALAVVLTPAAVGIELRRLLAARAAGPASIDMGSLIAPGILGMACSFVAGLAALRWLSRWLEGGRWHYFGVYCLVAAAGLFGLARAGY
jgi:undecaprenyl-diphosphatase